MPSPAIVNFGAGSFFIYNDENRHEVKELGDILRKHDVQYIDSGRAYYMSEQILGEDGLVNDFKITTKIDYNEKQTEENVLKSAAESFKLLKTDKIWAYFMHFPDMTTPIEETMEGIQKLYLEGRFERFGVSNFNLTEFKHLYEYAKSKNYVLPSIFQLNYNLISRKAEAELLPYLRSVGVTVQAYAPIAGGFLAKTPEQIASFSAGVGGRWDPSTPVGGLYNAMYNRASTVEFMKGFHEACQKLGESQAGVAFRWVAHNSFLDGEKGDQIIIGAMKPSQLENTLKEIEKGPLDAETVKRLDELWEVAKADANFDMGAIIYNRKDY